MKGEVEHVGSEVEATRVKGTHVEEEREDREGDDGDEEGGGDAPYSGVRVEWREESGSIRVEGCGSRTDKNT